MCRASSKALGLLGFGFSPILLPLQCLSPLHLLCLLPQLTWMNKGKHRRRKGETFLHYLLRAWACWQGVRGKLKVRKEKWEKKKYGFQSIGKQQGGIKPLLNPFFFLAWLRRGLCVICNGELLPLCHPIPGFPLHHQPCTPSLHCPHRCCRTQEGCKQTRGVRAPSALCDCYRTAWGFCCSGRWCIRKRGESLVRRWSLSAARIFPATHFLTFWPFWFEHFQERSTHDIVGLVLV